MRITWVPGQKVTPTGEGWSIKDTNGKIHLSTIMGVQKVPIFGQVYTIRDIFPYPGLGDLCLFLEEIVNPPIEFNNGWHEPAWRVFGEQDGKLNFRLVRDLKTDAGMSVLKKLLNPTPLPENAL